MSLLVRLFTQKITITKKERREVSSPNTSAKQTSHIDTWGTKHITVYGIKLSSTLDNIQ